ncbi:MAG TPA: type II secretion system protein [Candidatus Saccharimonadales bacterium]
MNTLPQPSGRPSGFTLLELMIYIGIVGMILTSISYLTLDIIGGQVSIETELEVNQNLRFASRQLERDIRAAESISVPSSDTLVLSFSGIELTYFFNASALQLTRQTGGEPAVELNTPTVGLTGSFTDISYESRTETVQVVLTAVYLNPDGLRDFDASSELNFSIEARARR